MKVGELIKELQKLDSDYPVIIKFALDPEDEMGHVLETKLVFDSLGQAIISCEYETTKDDCECIGARFLTENF